MTTEWIALVIFMTRYLCINTWIIIVSGCYNNTNKKTMYTFNISKKMIRGQIKWSILCWIVPLYKGPKRVGFSV